jgi:type I restriction enzyme S subunit
MREFQLDELCEILDSKRVPLSAIQRSKRQGPYPYYGAQSVIDYVDDYLLDGEFLLVAEDGANLVTRTQDIANLVKGKIWVNNHAHILGYNGKCPLQLLGYILNHSNISPYVTGCAQPKLNQDNLRRIPIKLPEKVDEVFSILSSLENKITVNKKICENLEAQAQALFKHWFVDFAPFKDGKFVESELGLIPEGWRVGTLGDIAELRKPSIKPQDNILYTHYSIPAFDNSKKPTVDEGSTIKSNKFGINDGAVLLSKLNPSTKRIWYTGKVPEHSVSSTEFLPFYSKNKEFTPFIYCYLNCDKNYREIANGAKGTTNSHQRIDANSILIRGLAYSEEVIRDFCDCCKNFMKLILEANQESSRLAEIRDILLPKLMSGELQVNEIEKSL